MPHSAAYLLILGALASVILATAKATSFERVRLFLRSSRRNVAEVISAGIRQAFARPLVAVAMLALAALGFALAVPLGTAARYCGPRHRACAPSVSTTTTTASGTTTYGTTTTSATTTAPTTTTTSATTTAQATTTGQTTTAATTTNSTSGSVAWRGDYETGNFSQWWLTQFAGGIGCGGTCGPTQIGSGTATIVTSPVAQGQYATAFVDGPHVGTDPCNCDRSEVAATQQESGGYPGQEWYYGWYTDFPGPSQQFWPNGDGWNDFVQFFSTGGSAWIYLGIGANNGTPKIISNGPWGNTPILTPLQFDHWYHFVVHAIWSTDPSVGLFEVYVDGTKIFSTHAATLQNASTPENSNYTVPGMVLSQGFYRGASSFTNTVIQDGFCRASSYDAAAGC
jgi:hypothetical protein